MIKQTPSNSQEKISEKICKIFHVRRCRETVNDRERPQKTTKDHKRPQKNVKRPKKAPEAKAILLS